MQNNNKKNYDIINVKKLKNEKSTPECLFSYIY